VVHRRDELQCDEDDDSEGIHVQQQDVGNGSGPGLPGWIQEVEDKCRQSRRRSRRR
jgi:hypothetical protein